MCWSSSSKVHIVCFVNKYFWTTEAFFSLHLLNLSSSLTILNWRTEVLFCKSEVFFNFIVFWFQKSWHFFSLQSFWMGLSQFWDRNKRSKGTSSVFPLQKVHQNVKYVVNSTNSDANTKKKKEDSEPVRALRPLFFRVLLSSYIFDLGYLVLVGVCGKVFNKAYFEKWVFKNGQSSFFKKVSEETIFLPRKRTLMWAMFDKSVRIF